MFYPLGKAGQPSCLHLYCIFAIVLYMYVNVFSNKSGSGSRPISNDMYMHCNEDLNLCV